MENIQRIEKIEHLGSILAIILRSTSTTSGVEFFTGDELPQQLALMGHPEGKVLEPHIHKKIDRSVSLTSEVLVLRKGRLRVDLFSDEKVYLKSTVLECGDIILLPGYGGHGFKAMTDVDLVEIKQGPYLGEKDKVRFGCISDDEVIWE